MQPDLQLVPVDSTRKKIEFVAATAPHWASATSNPLVGRAEELGQDPQHRQRYDRVVVRAVAALPILAELALPLLREDGLLVAQKGPISAEELNAGRRASGEVGGKVQVVDPLTLPILGDARTLIVIEKLKPTPAKVPPASGRTEPSAALLEWQYVRPHAAAALPGSCGMTVSSLAMLVVKELL